MNDTVRFESLRRRPPAGTQIDLGGHAAVHFKPDDTGREFADVPADKAHVLDRIPEGFRRVDENGDPVTAQPRETNPGPTNPVTPVTPVTQTQNTPPADPDLVPVSDVENDDEPETGGDKDSDPNTPPIEGETETGGIDTESGNQTDSQTVLTGPTEGDSPADLEALDDDALRDLFEKKVGRKPSPRAGRATLIDQIKQAVSN